MIPMGALNPSTKRMAMMMNLKNGINQQRNAIKKASKIIVDDALVYRLTVEHLLECFIKVMYALKPHHTTLKMRKCKWFQYR